MSTILTTKRLTLREPRLSDAEAYAAGIDDFEVAKFVTPVPHPYSTAMARDWLGKAQPATPERSMFVVEHPQLGLIGSVALMSELGFWIARAHWGQGYVTEASVALLAWHFAHTDSRTVPCSAQIDNAASLAVQAKLGFVEIGREVRFGQTLQRDIEHISTSLTRTAFAQRWGQ